MKLARYVKKIFYYLGQVVIFSVFYPFPIREGKITFFSDAQGVLNGNLKAMYDALDKEKYIKKTFIKDGREKKRSIGEFFSMCFSLSTSRIIFLDDYADVLSFFPVKKGQELVQLWHGSGAFKRFGRSREGADLKHIHPGYKRYTLAIVSSEHIRKDYADSFGIPIERVKATGIPRTDVFFDEEWKKRKRREFYETYPDLKDKKIILFAPTYRGGKVEDARYDFSKFDPKKIMDIIGDGYRILVKWHPAMVRNISLGKIAVPEGFYDNAVDVSGISDINNLLPVADILVTDYSSVIFDYHLFKKPIIFHAYDLDEYGGGRGLFYPFEEYCCGTVTGDMDGLAKAILDPMEDEKKTKAFHEKFVFANDGMAVRRILDILGLEGGNV